MLFLIIILALLTALLGFPIIYYVWMRNKAKKSWNINVDASYQPKVTLVIPTYNEATVITKKLENTQQIDYPEDKLQVIVVDSASTDDTVATCRNFLEQDNLRFPMRLLVEKERMGKSHALNLALEHAEGEILAISDADSFWEPDALHKALSFFADPSVGAVTGREQLSNLEQSVHTLSEGLYRKFYYALRLGESKTHSTLIFQGELSLFRRSILEKFEDRPGYSDDTGTVIDIISKGYRCIFTPDATFHDTAAISLRGKLRLKSRRAQHLIAGIIESLKLKIQGKLPLSSLIVLFNFYFHVLHPFILIFTALAVVLYFYNFWYLLLLGVIPLLFKKSRVPIISYLTGNVALIIGLINHLTRRKEVTWQKIEEMRSK